MTRLGTLVKLNIKRAFQSLFSLVFGAIALIFLVGAIAFCGNEFLYGGNASSSSSNPLSIAVVMYDDSLLANTISQGISSNPKVTETIAFDFVAEDAAISGLEKGTYIAAIIIAEDTADSILDGTNIPIQIAFPENSGMEAILIKEIADAAATLLSSAQAGIYSIYDIYDDYDANEHLDGALLRMNLKYITYVAAGSKLFDINEVSSTGSTPLLTYYVCSGLVLFMMLLSINCYSFADRLPAIACMRMSQYGTPLLLQEITSYIGILVGQLLTLLIVALPAVPILGIYGINLSADNITAMLVILPISALVSSAFAYAISRLTTHSLGRIMISFVSTIIMCFVSGCFIPTVMLPDALLSTGKFTPTYYMIDLATSVITGSFNMSAIAMCVCFTIILVTIGSIASHIRLRRELR